MVVVVALVFLIAGDLSSVVNPLLKTLGAITSASNKKTQPVRTAIAKEVAADDDDDEKEAIKMLGALSKAKVILRKFRKRRI